MGSKQRKMMDRQRKAVGEVMVVTENGLFLHAYSSIPVHVIHVDLADFHDDDLTKGSRTSVLMDPATVAANMRSTQDDEECLTVDPTFNIDRVIENAEKYLCSDEVMIAQESIEDEVMGEIMEGDYEAMVADDPPDDDDGAEIKYHNGEETPSLPLPYTELLLAEASAREKAKKEQEVQNSLNSGQVTQTAAIDQDEISDL